jgi:hypothetical protein
VLFFHTFLSIYSFRIYSLDALRQMLSFGKQEANQLNNCLPAWKILIYDTYGHDIISPLLKIGELRSLGVTLHL